MKWIEPTDKLPEEKIIVLGYQFKVVSIVFLTLVACMLIGHYRYKQKLAVLENELIGMQKIMDSYCKEVLDDLDRLESLVDEIL